MQYFANGVADDLHMDFSDFVTQGRLAEFTGDAAALLMPLSIVTGATGGLGYGPPSGWRRPGITWSLPGARPNAEPTLWPGCGGRSRRQSPNSRCATWQPAGVAGFAAGLAERPVDVLVNNAGVMGSPSGLTPDGFEASSGSTISAISR